MAREQGARVAVITNTSLSQIHRLSHGALLTRAGVEIGVASTKCYTAQLLAGGLLALHLARVRGVIEESRLDRLLKDAGRLPELVEEALGSSDAARELATRYHRVTSALFIGRRYNLPTALEGALKLKEISYIHAEGYGAGEMKHGPIALVVPDYPVFAVALEQSSVYEKMLSNIQAVRARRGPVIAVATRGDTRLGELTEAVLSVPRCEELWSPILAVVPLQLFAYHAACLRGCDVDQPRNLAKSVTVE
jgi:glucosamine--fructose-6-phosphate aminotransferase (isomerizing)